MLNDARMLFRFQRDLHSFLRSPVCVSEAQRSLRHYLENRDQSFLQLLDAAVYRQARSPWRALLQSARIEFGDLRELVQRCGIERTLAALHDAGVFLTTAEIKGSQPIVRSGAEIRARPEDFDNPVIPGSLPALTSGSSGPPRRLLIDIALLDHDVHAQRLFLHSFDLEQRPMAIWRPVPPGAAGLKRAILQARYGVPAERWFSQTNPALRAAPFKSWVFLQAALAVARRRGRGLPSPEYVPLDRVSAIAAWLASKREQGACAHLDTMVSAAIRVCQAAQAGSLDISGTFFRVGSESLSDSRAAVLRSAGTLFAVHYSLSETGPVGMACAGQDHVDDVHLLSSKIAVLPRPRADGRSALFLTTLLAGAPRILLNVESGDSAVVESRSCSCPFGAAGYLTHLHNIRSYEKVSGEGMYVLGAELASLVDHFLPQRFGGAPTDYQFVHEQREGLNRVSIVISPRVGPLEPEKVRNAVLKRLAAASRGSRMKSQIWASGDVLTVERGEPSPTAAAKIPPVRFINTD